MNIPKHVPKWTSATSKEQKNTQIGGKKYIAPKLILLSSTQKAKDIKFLEFRLSLWIQKQQQQQQRWQHHQAMPPQSDRTVVTVNRSQTIKFVNLIKFIVQVWTSPVELSCSQQVINIFHQYWFFFVCLLFFNSSIKLKPNKVILLRNIYIEQASFLLVKNSILCHKTRVEKRRWSEGQKHVKWNTKFKIPNPKYSLIK